MPILDDERGVLVLRIVYDGPPFSGKTTTLRALSEGLGASVVTPEERDGRTLWFDWLDYVGGLYEGRRIRCQVVSVPGQAELGDRRALLLEGADAVVLVADTTPTPFERTLELLEDLTVYCRRRQPPTGIVVQANKRDHPDALAREEVRERLDAVAPVALTETVATTGSGVREAFVFGVRLALDRVRAMTEIGSLPVGRPEIDDADGLLTMLQEGTNAASGRRNDARPPASPALGFARAEASAASGVDGVVKPAEDVGENAETNDEERPFRPDPLMPGGFIWPPVDGRTLLHEVAQLGIAPARTAGGHWSAVAGGWRCHSNGDDLFDDVDTGRAALIEWARRHAACLSELSPGRVLILADAGHGRYRLWQMVRIEPGLRETLETTVVDASTDEVVDALLAAAKQLLRARFAIQSAHLPLPISLWTIGTDSALEPRFVGLMPGRNAAPPPLPPDELLAREFRPLVHSLRERDDFTRIVQRLRRQPESAASVLAELH